MMDIKEFILNFSEQFEETESSIFSKDTRFKDLDEWSSIMALSIIAMVDDEYGVKVKGEDIRNSATIEDLFNIVNGRK